MPHDIVIRRGNIVDGSGKEAFVGDLAIDGDTITSVGKVSKKGKREIDASDHIVTPGFIDLHTHFDAQAAWDPMLTPVSWHGVTTALFGNCGVTFAPCKPEGRDFLAGMMETVEDIPKRAILEGLPWNWESYGEYLDSIEKLDPAINVTGLVGHCASRFYVMGERAVDEDPTAEEIEQIAALVGQSVRDGAVGFSSNRLPQHVLPDGRSIPGTFAKSKELDAISKAVGENGGILQFVLNYSNIDQEMDLITEQGAIANTKVLFSAPYGPGAEGHQNAYDRAVSSMRSKGIDVSGLTLPRSGGFLSGLTTDISFPGPVFDELRQMDFDARLAAIKDPIMRGRLIASVKSISGIEEHTKNVFWLGNEDQPNYVREADESLYSLALKAGEHPVETWIRYMLDSEGQTLFHSRFFNHDLEKVSEFLQSDWILPGIGDAGAHVSQIMDSGWPSFMLSHWCRNNKLFTIQEAIRKLTSAQARVLGLSDRGILRPGARADANIVNLDKVAERQPKLVHDFPNNAPRLIQKAVGYKATLVNGNIILEDDEHTGSRPGRVLRNGS
tara:strand:- start:1676 stop:3343 length:1668 start_codon:yes stop_codon:yes gene_type:complete